MMWGYYGGDWWWMLFGGFFMLLFWGAVIGLIVWGVRQFTRGREGDATLRETPLQIARRRFARGEITREQFEELKQGMQ
jgi:putative membrane protein